MHGILVHKEAQADLSSVRNKIEKKFRLFVNFTDSFVTFLYSLDLAVICAVQAKQKDFQWASTCLQNTSHVWQKKRKKIDLIYSLFEDLKLFFLWF